ncbi:hypothetical protein G7Z17_g11953 [Cylindrodendrum hubeiense]|uniref:Heterokaryon incompatibility domain-containing protein n=1 Tax=Cylindrodendrum hubeiense TaxID=595255 RepID=A0A9P5GWH5_9HYPO|nr:hypothetical protein G7Z17_g11953 [Cylindrodendrum hubeiense]
MEHSSPYQYLPLQRPRNIRILRLSGGTSRILFAELVETTLGNHQSYEAISYSWGKLDKSHTLAIQGGSTIKIAESLYNALRATRHSKIEDGARNLWADGVCINQGDQNERSQQVMLMAEVYQSAHRVITYIGENTLKVDRGINLANNLISCFEERRKTINSATVLNVYAKHSIPSESDPDWASLRDFLDRSWYTRIWIIQESVQNPNMIMMCGDVEIDWNIFAKLSSMIQQGELNQFVAIQPYLARTYGSTLPDSERSFEKSHAPASLGRAFEEYVRPVKLWARIEALEELLRHHPSRQPKPPDIDPAIMEAWRRDLCLKTVHSGTGDGRENIFSLLRQGKTINQRQINQGKPNQGQRGYKYYGAVLHAGNLHRKLFTTKAGYIGMGAAEIQAGDVVAFFSGAKVPFVLRRQKGSSGHTLVADCYVHGLMNGEAWRGGRGTTRVLTLM